MYHDYEALYNELFLLYTEAFNEKKDLGVKVEKLEYEAFALRQELGRMKEYVTQLETFVSTLTPNKEFK